MNNRVTLMVFVLLSAAAAYAGPFGTFDSMPWWVRVVYWTLIVGISVFMGYFTRGISVALLPEDRPILVDLLATAMMTFLFTPIVWGLTALFGDPSAPDFPSVFKLMTYVAPLVLLVFIARRVLPGVEDRSYFDAPPPPECPRLLQRLENPEGRILRLSSRDHFVDVVFADRTETLRMRFRDAVNEMEPITGACVHRSHWVADGAVKGPERADGRLWLILENGDRVPVSRGYRSEAEARGWV